MSREVLLSRIGDSLQITGQEREIAANILLQWVVARLRVDQSIRIRNVGVFQLKKEPMPREDRKSVSADSPVNNRTLLYNPGNDMTSGSNKSSVVSFDLNELNINSDDYLDKVFSLNIDKPLIPIQDVDSAEITVAAEVGSQGESLEEKIELLVKNGDLIEDLNIFEDEIIVDDTSPESGNLDDDDLVNEEYLNTVQDEIDAIDLNEDNLNDILLRDEAEDSGELEPDEDDQLTKDDEGNKLEEEISFSHEEFDSPEDDQMIAEPTLEPDDQNTDDSIDMADIKPDLTADEIKIDDYLKDQVEFEPVTDNLEKEPEVLSDENELINNFQSADNSENNVVELNSPDVEEEVILEDTPANSEADIDFFESMAEAENTTQGELPPESIEPPAAEEEFIQVPEPSDIDAVVTLTAENSNDEDMFAKPDNNISEDAFNEVPENNFSEEKSEDEVNPEVNENSEFDDDFELTSDLLSSSDDQKIPGKKSNLNLIIILVSVFAVIGAAVYIFVFEFGIVNTFLKQDPPSEEVVVNEPALEPETEEQVADTPPVVEPTVQEPAKVEEITPSGLYRDIPNDRAIRDQIYFDGSNYTIQVSSWKTSSIAEQEVERLRAKNFDAFIFKVYLESKGSTWHRVRIGYFNSVEEAAEFKLKNKL